MTRTVGFGSELGCGVAVSAITAPLASAEAEGLVARNMGFRSKLASASVIVAVTKTLTTLAASKVTPLRNRTIQVVVAVMASLALCGGVQAQTFQSVPALNFTVPVGNTNALPQLVMVNSGGLSFGYYDTVSTSSGGGWLSVPACSDGNYPCATPTPVAVFVNANALSTGTYQGQIVFTDVSNTAIKLTVPVTLTVEPLTAAFFDNLPSGLSFFLKTSGTAVAQQFQIRNGGAATLSWSLSTNTADGGSWLTASATSGTAPSTISIGITPSALPGGGASAGTFEGEIVLQSSADTTTIPVSITVGTSIFEQVNPLVFTMPVGGANPLPQIATIESANNSAIPYFTNAFVANSGNWLYVPDCSDGNYPCYTSSPFAVNIVSASTLAAGTYMGEVIAYQDTNPQMAVSVPVTLIVVPSGAFFNNLPGALSFSLVKGSGTGVSQTIPITNAGTGTLNWTAATSTSDGAAWLTATPGNGTAPSQVTIHVDASLLPGAGAVAGTFVGQVLLQTGVDTTTIPVAVTVGANVFNQVNPISFTMPVGGANPLAQIITLANTEGNPALDYYQVTSTASGGSWLSVPACSDGNYPCYTPNVLTVSVVNASTLAAGTYVGEVTVYQDTNPAETVTVPVALNVVASGAYFNNLPGQLDFSLVPDGKAVPQTIEIENGGSGTLDWTVATATSDGGAWLSTSAASGAAPSEVNVVIDTTNLPGSGALAGTYTGQLLFQTGSDTTTIPVAVTVAADVFAQVNPISFTMPVGGANPLPQILEIASMVYNSPFEFYQCTATATGGNWLSTGGCSDGNYPFITPFPLTVGVVNGSTLAAGTYTGEVILYEDTNPAETATVPVTLNVVNTGPFFNNLPGQLTFTMPQDAKAVTPQALEIGNGGSGTLKFTITPSTADGGAWLKASALSGTAPKTVSVEIKPANLPNAGQVAGIFVGQLLLKAGTDTVTIPVTVVVNDGAFYQVNPINFVMPVGGTNPLPQVLTFAGIGDAALPFYQCTASATGGIWLTTNGCSDGNYPYTTPFPLEVGVVNSSTLAAGVYTGQVTVYQDTNPGWSVTAPVTLTVVPTAKALFDNLPGQTSFSFVPGSTTTASQTIHIGEAGTGTLTWKIATDTADTGKWLKVTPASGTGAGSYTVSVTVKSLPGEGKDAGTFVGQTVLETATGNVTIPVAVTVGNSVFEQVAPLSFTATQGANPAPQSISIASTGTALSFWQATSTSKGGDWLSITTCASPNYPCGTPTSLTVSVNSSSLAAGTYVAQINVYEDTDPSEAMTIPVVLTITP